LPDCVLYLASMEGMSSCVRKRKYAAAPGMVKSTHRRALLPAQTLTRIARGPPVAADCRSTDTSVVNRYSQSIAYTTG